ncbi:unnamed protein product [marine sediment metagenome]|uniref:Uncharacterized protein n=1 Tax=marine sediment metagenome TaxID=412755 RepID=X1AR71_9ZZZZ
MFKLFRTTKLIFSRIWRECNRNCPHYAIRQKDKCKLDAYTLAPAIKCLLVHICKLLRQYEIDRNSNYIEEDDGDGWKNTGE